jgi:hypothetical protein
MKAVAFRSTGILPVGQPGVSPGEGSAAGKNAWRPYSQDGCAPWCYTG